MKWSEIITVTIIDKSTAIIKKTLDNLAIKNPNCIDDVWKANR
jgi:hypothetical protein